MRIWQILLSLLILCSARAETEACSQITSPSELQAAISDAGSEVSVCFEGTNQGSYVWSLQNEGPLVLEVNQKVTLNCNAQSFDYQSSSGNLTMGRGSVLLYSNCHLVHYAYPDHGSLYGSEQQFADSWIGMDSCQFVEDLGDTYAEVLSKSQPNATFLLGELVALGDGSAVHMFYAAFDSLAGPQVRFTHHNTTAYCGDSAAIQDADDLAFENGPVVTQSSESYAEIEAGPVEESEEESEEPDSTSAQTPIPAWFIATATVSGVALVVIAVLTYFVWQKRRLQQQGQQDAQQEVTQTEGNTPGSHQVDLGSKESMEEHALKLSEKHNVKLS